MSRRTPSLLDTLVLMPWWVSAGLGLLSFLAGKILFWQLGEAGSFIAVTARGFGWLPYLLLLGFGGIALFSLIFRQRNNELIEGRSSLELLRGLSWGAFELLVGEAYRRQGFRVEQSLSAGADGGVDLVLRKDNQLTVVQCKQWRTLAVGVPVIREVFGVMIHEQADRAIVITSGSFTREALAFARGKPMELIDGPALLALVREVQTSPKSPDVQPAAPAVAVAEPLCPKCQAPMVGRIARRGPKAGATFWGCSTYPRCNGTRPKQARPRS